jgi:hypothetical protein
MTNSRNVMTEVVRWLDAVGGEPLPGSGFEGEQPTPGFAELTAGEVGSAGRE